MGRINRLENGFESPKVEESTTAVVDGTDYMDPEVQDAILNPKPIKVMLQFEDDRPNREISILTAFTPTMVKRRTLDEVGSLCNSVMAYLSEKTPDRRLPTQEWINGNTAWMGWAACKPDVRQEARPLIAKLANCSLVDIEDGLSDGELATITLALMTIFAQLRKNAVRGKTAPASVPEPSTLV